MTPDPDTVALLEHNFGAAYRAEFDQNENVWRSLPFFATAVALQLATLFQVVDRMPPLATWLGRAAAGLLASSAAAAMVALGFLAGSIWPATLVTITDERALLAQAEVAGVSAADMRLQVCGQYADAIQNNRAINRRRRRRRAIAGLATVTSLFLTTLLVAATVLHYIR